ncbi:N-formylglutamate amidohydrolase [Polystyrenella longa]|uniref:N-formylglutamate amidohydrolase n=1 Tax=Polystyrenella longa TaxID=2528007 RepID=A0A518CT15_9PLAN|nr:N-formylglutamate amidohydrolase [Polystyrenella longa]QDU82356.1 N-formylglutamate amidohydrolase [Polystyrenella longa]
MALSTHCIFERGSSPIIAAAVHNGHDTRVDVDEHLAMDEKEQRREEDPVTGEWTQIAKTQIVGLRSRFEVDLNRPRDKAVYKKPEDAWGIEVWDEPPDQELIEKSLKEYDDFYASIRELLDEMLEQYPRVVVLDLHTYNQFREGPEGQAADPTLNPEVNIGTGTMDRIYWAPVVDRFISDLKTYDFHGRHLDVRENVKFQGGYFGQWIHEHYPERVCSIAIEFKKFFMDEWEGEPDAYEVECIYRALRSTLPGVRTALEDM